MTTTRTGSELTSTLSYETLKRKQRAIRSGFPSGAGLRVHRAISWLQRAEQEVEDHDASFIFCWIAFNAAYADEVTESPASDERSVFDEFFLKLTDLDRDQRIYNTIWDRYAQEIRLLPAWTIHERSSRGWRDAGKDCVARTGRRAGVLEQYGEHVEGARAVCSCRSTAAAECS